MASSRLDPFEHYATVETSQCNMLDSVNIQKVHQPILKTQQLLVSGDYTQIKCPSLILHTGPLTASSLIQGQITDTACFSLIIVKKIYLSTLQQLFYIFSSTKTAVKCFSFPQIS